MNYEGSLEFKDGDGILEISRFIIRNGSIAISAESYSNYYGRWQLDTTLHRKGTSYAASGIQVLQQKIKSDLVSLKLEVKVSLDSETCSVKGIWSDSEGEWEFSGELRAQPRAPADRP